MLSVMKSTRALLQEMNRDLGQRLVEAGGIDPSKPMGGRGVAYFDIDGDGESIAVAHGEVPLQAVAAYLQKRLRHAKATPSHRPGELTVHFTGWNGKPATFTTKVDVKSRK